MGKPDMEDVIEALMQTFQGQFAAALAAVDARKTTQLNPKAPVQFLFGDSKNLPQMPAMLFTGHQTNERRDEYEWRDQQYNLMIEAYYPGQDVQQLSRVVRRYGAAIDDTLRSNNTLGGVIKNITNIQQRYWDTMSAKNGGLFQAVNVTFEAHLITD